MTAGNYSPNSSNYTYNYDSATSFDNLTRKSIEGHMKNQIDEQLLTKVSQLTLDRVTNKLAEKQRELLAANKELARSYHGLLSDKEEFYWFVVAVGRFQTFGFSPQHFPFRSLIVNLHFYFFAFAFY